MFDLYTEGSTYSKYRVVETEYGTGTLAPDGKKTLELDDDAARAVMGDKWRMPTKTEMEELVNSCTWTWTTVNNVKGYKVTSKKKRQYQLYLPAGHRIQVRRKFERKRIDMRLLDLFTGNDELKTLFLEGDIVFKSRRVSETQVLRPACQGRLQIGDLFSTSAGTRLRRWRRRAAASAGSACCLR